MKALVNSVKEQLVALHHDEEGATMIEYGVLIGLITVAIIVLISTVGGQLVNAWTSLTNALTAGGL